MIEETMNKGIEMKRRIRFGRRRADKRGRGGVH
jgi:hypothetical protein